MSDENETDENTAANERRNAVMEARRTLQDITDDLGGAISRLTRASLHRDLAGQHLQVARDYLGRQAQHLGVVASSLAWTAAHLDAAGAGGKKVPLASALDQRWSEVRNALPESARGQMVERRRSA